MHSACQRHEDQGKKAFFPFSPFLKVKEVTNRWQLPAVLALGPGLVFDACLTRLPLA